MGSLQLNQSAIIILDCCGSSLLVLLFRQLYDLLLRREPFDVSPVDLALFASARGFLLLEDPVESILVDLVQVVVHLHDGTLPNSLANLVQRHELITVDAVDTFLDLLIHSLFDHYVSELVFALLLLQLVLRSVHIYITLAHIVVPFMHLLLEFLFEGELHGPPRVQVLIALQEGILDPEHERIHGDGHDDHDDDELDVRVPMEDRKDGVAPADELDMIRELEEEDEDLG